MEINLLTLINQIHHIYPPHQTAAAVAAGLSRCCRTSPQAAHSARCSPHSLCPLGSLRCPAGGGRLCAGLSGRCYPVAPFSRYSHHDSEAATDFRNRS